MTSRDEMLLWDDNPSALDLLGFADVAAPVAAAIRRDHLDPVCVGVFGAPTDSPRRSRTWPTLSASTTCITTSHGPTKRSESAPPPLWPQASPNIRGPRGTLPTYSMTNFKLTHYRRVATTHTSPTQIAVRHAAQSKCASDGSRPIPG